jgi:DNA-dependent protein kinase catalytic subunit
MKEEEEEKDFLPSEDAKAEDQLEMDNVNQHECMRNIKRCIDKMVELFKTQTWEQDPGTMPLFMQALNQEARRPETHINVKIFILKIVINNPTLFEPYAAHWFEPIASYICEKSNGGKGFHYFMRDLCTLLISWSKFTPEETPKNKNLCTQMVNTLVKYSADKAKMIFNTNICKSNFSHPTVTRNNREPFPPLEETDRNQQGHPDHDGGHG